MVFIVLAGYRLRFHAYVGPPVAFLVITTCSLFVYCRHMNVFTVLKPCTRLISEMYYQRDPAKIW